MERLGVVSFIPAYWGEGVGILHLGKASPGVF